MTLSDQIPMRDTRSLLKMGDIVTPLKFMKTPPTPINTDDIYFQATPLPYIKPSSAHVPPPLISNGMLNAVHDSDAVKATITLLTTVGALPDDLEEFDFTPAVPSSISSPPHPVPFLQLFGPNKTPTMLLETWNNEYLTMTIVMPTDGNVTIRVLCRNRRLLLSAEANPQFGYE
jgi:hypothetical protein